uniref:Uncharacterized protein n=1 Tax=Rhizophora mucronata TaxID=61149 RepID=A0A2P2IQC2_RHIMU
MQVEIVCVPYIYKVLIFRALVCPCLPGIVSFPRSAY